MAMPVVMFKPRSKINKHKFNNNSNNLNNNRFKDNNHLKMFKIKFKDLR